MKRVLLHLLAVLTAWAYTDAQAAVVGYLGETDSPYFCGDNIAHDYINRLPGGNALWEACAERGSPDGDIRLFEVANSLFNYWVGSPEEFYPSGRKYRFESDADVSEFLFLVADAGGFTSEFETPDDPPPGEYPCLAGYWICWTGEAWRHDTFFRVYDASKQSTYVRLVDVTPAVSEPATLALLGAGVLGLAAVRRRRNPPRPSAPRR